MLTSAQIQSFNQSGYLVVESLLDDELLSDIRREYELTLRRECQRWHELGKLGAEFVDQSFDEQLLATIDAGLDYFQPLDISLPISEFQPEVPIHLGEQVFRMMRNEKTLDAVEDLIGPELTSNPIQHVRIKPPLAQVAEGEDRAHIIGTDWHQDRAVARKEADLTRMVTVWIAITDATLENGCLQVIPGSHKEVMHPHCPARQLGIPHQTIDIDSAMPLPVKAGGAVLFHPLTIHGSRENTSDSIRWSFDLRYNVTGDATGRPQFPDFIARSRQNPSSELHDWKTWSDSWLATRERLAGHYQDPLSYHCWNGSEPICA